MADFSTAHAPVAVWEGGYGNHPADRGGETLCGIARGCHPDLALWKLVDAEKDHPSFRQGSAAFTRHLRQIPGLLEQVTAFYRGLFHSLGLDSEDMPQELANEIYEQVVNLGQGGHTRYLQRICNAFNYNRKTGTRLFHDLKEDGALGTLTRAALRVLIEKRTTQAVLVHALNGAQAMHYINLAAGNETQRCFLDGWLTEVPFSAADETGLMHYRARIASINAQGEVIDLRPPAFGDPVKNGGTLTGLTAPSGELVSHAGTRAAAIPANTDWAVPRYEAARKSCRYSSRASPAFRGTIRQRTSSGKSGSPAACQRPSSGTTRSRPITTYT